MKRLILCQWTISLTLTWQKWQAFFDVWVLFVAVFYIKLLTLLIILLTSSFNVIKQFDIFEGLSIIISWKHFEHFVVVSTGATKEWWLVAYLRSTNVKCACHRRSSPMTANLTCMISFYILNPARISLALSMTLPCNCCSIV